ncbi:MAG: hypothetical protein JO250_16580 [Armatimonadetes bacterium]|nr:hypothetical protein [Armatimonadota bacterium]
MTEHPKKKMERREFLKLSGGLLLAATGGGMLTGCGGGGGSFGGPNPSGGAPAAGNLVLINNNTGVGVNTGQDLAGSSSKAKPRAAASVGAVIYPVLAVQNLQQYNGLFWGTKDSSGTAQNVTESLHWTSDPGKAVRFLYDSQGRLAQSINQDTGQFLTYQWDVAGQCTLHSYDSGANLLGAAVVQINGTTGTVGPLPASRAAYPPPAFPINPMAATGSHSSLSDGLQNIKNYLTPSPQFLQGLQAVGDILAGAAAGGGVATLLAGAGVALTGAQVAALVAAGAAIGFFVGVLLPQMNNVTNPSLTDANPFGNSPAYAYQQYSPGPNGYYVSDKNNSIWAGNYSGAYSGAESGTWSGTVGTDGVLNATAATSAGPFVGSATIGGAGQTTIGFSGSGAAGQFAITFTGMFAYEGAGSIQGSGSWSSSSGESGSWQGQGSNPSVFG